MTLDTEVAIIGAGVVGLACAAEIARRGRAVVVLERHGRAGTEVSSRNSQVVHAGLYHPKGSLKADTCVEGRALLYERCERLGITHRKTGKLVVASDDSQRTLLEQLFRTGLQNGAGALELLDATELARREPRVQGVAALWSPESGIVDVHELVDSFRREALAHGASVAFRHDVVRLERCPRGWLLDAPGPDGEPQILQAEHVVNAAGLSSDTIAALAGVDVRGRGLVLRPWKGDYFGLSGRHRNAVSRLVYPVPDAHGVGIHLTLDLDGSLRAGPDATPADTQSHAVDPGKAPDFARAVRRYYPKLDDEDLSPAFAGLRPRLAAEGPRDFVVEQFPEAPGIVHLIGIESPGLTAAPALARRVARLLTE